MRWTVSLAYTSSRIAANAYAYPSVLGSVEDVHDVASIANKRSGARIRRRLAGITLELQLQSKLSVTAVTPAAG